MNDNYAVKTIAGTVVSNRYLLPRLGTPWQRWADRKIANVALQPAA